MFRLSLPRVVVGLAALAGVLFLAEVIVRQAEADGIAERGQDDLDRMAGRTRVKLQAVREYESGRIDLATAAGRFAEADQSDPRRMADLRERLGSEPDHTAFAHMVLEYVVNNDSAQPHRPPQMGRATAEFKRLYRTSPFGRAD